MVRALLVFAAALGLATPAQAEPTAPTAFYVAASFLPAGEALAQDFRALGGKVARPSAGASGRLARRLALGAQGGVLVSADKVWIDWLRGKGLAGREQAAIASGSMALLVRARTSLTLDTTLTLDATLPARLRGRMAIAHPDTAPAGARAQEVLRALGLWHALRHQIVYAPDAAAAAAWLRRGGVNAALVYASMAHNDSALEVAAHTNPAHYRPVVYQAALVGKNPNPQAQALFAYLQTPPTRRRLAAFGLMPPP